MSLDPKSHAALRDALRRDLLPDFLRAVEAGFKPRVVGIRRSTSGVAVRLALGQGVHFERDVVLDGRSFDLRVRLGILEAVITSIVAETVREIAVVKRLPITLGSAP